MLVADPDLELTTALTLRCPSSYEIISATTGELGLSILRRRPVDLILVEQRLPDCSGLQLLRQVRDGWPRLPAIMVTAYGSESVCVAAFKQGVRDYVIKPCAASRLVAAIQDALGAGAGPSRPRGVTPGHSPGSAPSPLPASATRSVPPSRPSGAAGAEPLDTTLDARLLTVERAVRFVQEHYWERTSLAAVAREVGASPSALSHRFKAAVGVSFRSYCLRLRVQKAKALLRSRQYSITDVAHMVGFGDLPRFDKVFKQLTGSTPRSYRAAALKGGEPDVLEGDGGGAANDRSFAANY